ncbi:MAG TPA: DM13 domain-containing protein [Euzebya sp.]|nr:DM13 domain-containing protein [Euzebya sp.]
MSTTTKVGGVALLVVVVAVAVWLIRPLFVDTVVDEAFPSTGVVPDDMTVEQVESEMAEAAATSTEVQDEPMPDAAPTVVIAGDFAGVDDAHRGSGSATIYAVEGSHVLRLEDFDVTNGPDLHVYLSPVGSDGQPDVDAGTDLGPLRGNIGNQNYDIPSSVDLEQPLAVVIWCVPFRVTFATALLG